MKQRKGEQGSEPASAKRGRPSTYHPEWRAQIARLFPEVKTERGLLMKCHEIAAVRLINETLKQGYPQLAWIADPEAMRAGRAGAHKPKLCSALGVIRARHGETTALAVAFKLCDEKPAGLPAALRIVKLITPIYAERVRALEEPSSESRKAG